MGFVLENITSVETIDTAPLGIRIGSNTNIFDKIYDKPEQAKENLKNLLLTNIGERYMLPNFGCNLARILFDPISDNIKTDIDNSINKAVSKWLPYISIKQIDIKTFEDDPSLEYAIRISVTFSVNNFSKQTIQIFVSELGSLVIQ